MEELVIPEDVVLEDVVVYDKRLGRSAFAVVYLGRWCGVDVAVKRIHTALLPGDAADSGFMRRLSSEWALLRSLRHPNIVQIFGVVDATSGTPGLVSERMAITLQERYRRSPQLTHAEVQLLAKDVAAGLSYLHRRLVVHRSVSTKSIFVDSTSLFAKAKISDAGMFKVVEGGSPETRQEKSFTGPAGLAAYMPPEVLCSDPSYESALDVFCLGVTLLAVLVRREPDMWKMTASGQSTEVIRRQADLECLSGQALKPLILACLDDQPSKRPSADSLLVDLDCLSAEVSQCAEATSLACQDTFEKASKITDELERCLEKVSKPRREDGDLSESQGAVMSMAKMIDDMRTLLKDVHAGEQVATATDGRHEMVVGLSQSDISHQLRAVSAKYEALKREKADLIRAKNAAVEALTVMHKQNVESVHSHIMAVTGKLDKLKQRHQTVTKQLVQLCHRERAKRREGKEEHDGRLNRDVPMSGDLRHVKTILDLLLGPAIAASVIRMTNDRSVAEQAFKSSAASDDGLKLLSPWRLHLRHLLLSSGLPGGVGDMTLTHIARTCKWTSLKRLPAAVAGACHAIEYNGHLYVATSKVQSSGRKSETVVTVLSLEVASMNWTEVAGPPNVRYALAIFIHSATLYIVASDKNGRTYIFCLQPNGQTWKQVSTLPSGRQNCAVCRYSNYVFFAGGEDSAGPSSLMESYNLDNGSWEGQSRWPALPGKRNDASLVSLGNEVLLLNGLTKTGTELKVVQTVKALSGITAKPTSGFGPTFWKTHACCLTVFPFCGATVFQDHLVTAGGRSQGVRTTSVYCWSKGLGSWLSFPPLIFARDRPALIIVQGKLYCIGGGLGAEYGWSNTVEVLNLREDQQG